MLADDVAHQHPADRDAPAGMVPHRSAGQDIQLPLTLAIPLADRDTAPAVGWVGETLHEGRLALAGDPAAASGAGPAWRRRIEQPGIQTQAGGHGGAVTEGSGRVGEGVYGGGDSKR